MEHNNHKPNHATVAFLIGAVAGGVAALLLAPESGSQLRGRLRRRAGDLREKGEHLLHQGQERAESISGAMKSAATEARSAYRTEMDKQRESRPGSIESEFTTSKQRPGSA